jgi:hypothetical protein
MLDKFFLEPILVRLDGKPVVESLSLSEMGNYLKLINYVIPVRNDTRDFVFPGSHKHSSVVDDVAQQAAHSLPNARQIAQIENVVKFSWSG